MKILDTREDFALTFTRAQLGSLAQLLCETRNHKLSCVVELGHRKRTNSTHLKDICWVLRKHLHEAMLEEKPLVDDGMALVRRDCFMLYLNYRLNESLGFRILDVAFESSSNPRESKDFESTWLMLQGWFEGDNQPPVTLVDHIAVLAGWSAAQTVQELSKEYLAMKREFKRAGKVWEARRTPA